jgi:hypothetical protein
MRITGWSKNLLEYVEGKNVVTEDELLAFLLAQGRRINADWKTVVAHAMRAIGWRLREVSRTYIRKSAQAKEAA